MDLLFHDGTNSADMHYDYYVSPEEREEELERFRCSLGGKFCPNYLLKWADDYDLLPLGVLEEEQAAYLVPFYSLLNEINRLMLNDNKRQFAAFLIPNHELVQKYPPEALLQLLCIHDAVSCVAALLESRLDVDINYMDEKVVYLIGKAPLHIAAHNLCFRMTKLLLERGADADILADGCKTPLHMAVVACRSQIRIKGWTAAKSILDLFYILPELKEALDTVRLLASYSNEVEDLCIKYMSNGNVVSCVILLMAAWDKLMVPSAEGGLETTPVGQHLTRVLSNASLQQEICDRSFNTLSKENLVKNVTATLCVVENMWMTIAVLERYCHSKVQSVPIYELPIHITCELVKEAGLDLKPSVANI